MESGWCPCLLYKPFISLRLLSRFGLLTEEDAPRLTREVCEQEVRPRTLERLRPLMARNWRGRMGLSKVQSIELWEAYIKASKQS